jgi:hypothetical protein
MGYIEIRWSNDSQTLELIVSQISYPIKL